METSKMPQTDTLLGATSGRPSRPPRRILVVDDETMIRDLVTDVLSRSGYEVDTAEDGAIAWDKLQHQHYDLLVTDNTMPKLSGIDLIKRVRDASLPLPVIMATGTLPKEEFIRNPALLPAATLIKPYSIMEMLAKVETVLRHATTVIQSSQLVMRLESNDVKGPQPGEPARTSSSLPPKALQRILVVDRDSDLRLMYADVLAGPGYEVDAAEDGDAGWEALQSNRYNLLITENDLPQRTGIEVIRKMRAADISVPVIMAAEQLPTYLIARNPSLQISATLRKPFAVEELLDMVKGILRVTTLVVLLQTCQLAEIQAQDAGQTPAASLSSTNRVDQPIAMTLSVVGKCVYSDDGIAFKKLERGQILQQGTVVRAGENARADLFFRRTGTTVRLQADTEIRIERMAVTRKEGTPMVHTLLDIRAGRIFTVVRSTVPGSTLEIKNAAGRATVEGSGIGRYIITADGTHVSAKGSSIPLKVIGENGITIIEAGQQFAKKDGEMLPASPTDWVKGLIELDELQASTESFITEVPSTKP
ncbi:MAG: response regulator [Opitutaceae bacterium]|nr:response regulator [Verrucomicrobiales bacterium]